MKQWESGRFKLLHRIPIPVHPPYVAQTAPLAMIP